MFDFLEELFTERNEDSRYIKYHGDYEFWIDVKVKGDLPFQSSNIVINCFRTSRKDKEVPFECNWYRIIGEKNFEIKENAGCQYYKCSPYDIGSKVKVAIKAKSGFTGELAFVTFGPFELDPALKPYIEHHLLSCQGSFMFNLLKYDRNNIIDNSDFNNIIEFQDTQLGIRFCENFPELKDFSVDLGTKGMTLKCDYDDPRILTIYFKKGEEEAISASILVSKNYVSNMERRNKTYSKINYSDMISLEEDGKSQFIPKNPQEKEMGFVKFNPLAEEIDPEQLFELCIKFETRLLRDAFITSMRFMRVKGSLPLASIFDSVDVLLRKQWFPVDYEERSHDYILGCFELHSFRAILKRMLRINRNLSLENDNLNDCVDLLDNDLKNSSKEFNLLIEDLKKRKNTIPTEVKKCEKVERSMLDVSQQVEKMRISSRHDDLEKVDKRKEKMKMKVLEAEKVIKMEKELASRKKLNKMLLKEIQKLKGSTKGNSGSKKKNLGGGDKTFNLFHQNPFEDKRVNRSVLAGEKEDNYLIGLEEDLKDNNNPFMKELEKEVSKAKNNLDFNEIKQISYISKLEEEIAITKKRIQINQKAYNELLVLTSRINNGDTLNETETLYDQSIFSDFGINNAKNIGYKLMEDFLGQTKFKIWQYEGKNKGIKIEDPENNRFSFGANPAFESNYLGESNLGNAFGTNESQVKENQNLENAKNNELIDRIDELKKENIKLKNASESYEHQISDYKQRLSELLTKKKEFKETGVKKDEVVDLRERNNKTKKLIKLRKAFRKLEAEVEDLEEDADGAEIENLVQERLKEESEVKTPEKKEKNKKEISPEFGFKAPENEAGLKSGEKRASMEEIYDKVDDSLHKENLPHSNFELPHKEGKANLDDLDDILSDGGQGHYGEEILNEEFDKIQESGSEEEKVQVSGEDLEINQEGDIDDKPYEDADFDERSLDLGNIDNEGEEEKSENKEGISEEKEEEEDDIMFQNDANVEGEICDEPKEISVDIDEVVIEKKLEEEDYQEVNPEEIINDIEENENQEIKNNEENINDIEVEKQEKEEEVSNIQIDDEKVLKTEEENNQLEEQRNLEAEIQSKPLEENEVEQESPIQQEEVHQPEENNQEEEIQEQVKTPESFENDNKKPEDGNDNNKNKQKKEEIKEDDKEEKKEKPKLLIPLIVSGDIEEEGSIPE